MADEIKVWSIGESSELYAAHSGDELRAFYKELKVVRECFGCILFANQATAWTMRVNMTATAPNKYFRSGNLSK